GRAPGRRVRHRRHPRPPPRRERDARPRLLGAGSGTGEGVRRLCNRRAATDVSLGWSAAQPRGPVEKRTKPRRGDRDFAIWSVTPPGLGDWLGSHPRVSSLRSLHPGLTSVAAPRLQKPEGEEAHDHEVADYQRSLLRGYEEMGDGMTTHSRRDFLWSFGGGLG